MARCDLCGAEESLPYNCRYCGGQYCGDHRLPENHDCPGLRQEQASAGVFDSGFDDRIIDDAGDRSFLQQIGITSFIPGNVTYLFLLIMWVTFGLQLIVRAVAPELEIALFALDPANPEYVWTWISSIFAHGSLIHIAFNSIVIYFFGVITERYIGSKTFFVLFIVSGVIAGFSQIIATALAGDPTPVLGASGAALAILGVLTILNPSLKVYLYFLLPMPLWVLTIGFLLLSLVIAVFGGFGYQQIGHIAHIVGIVIGLGYGIYAKRQGIRAPSRVRFGGGGQPPMRRRF